MAKPFLTAHWQHLALVTYAVPVGVLEPYLTADLEADACEQLQDETTSEPVAYVSLVAFDFMQTKVMGVKWPGFVNFPEVNLRAYVREKGGEKRRGVTFVRELVPSRMVAWIARLTYNEPYAAAKMSSEVREEAGRLHVQHGWTLQGQSYRLDVEADAQPKPHVPDSVEQFFKEHRWGFGRDRRGGTLTYEVRHPVWRTFDIKAYTVDVDFAALYGEPWGFLSEATPVHVMLAEGSDVAVYPKR